MNIKINSILTKLIIYFLIFISIIVIVLWTTQSVFLASYYNEMLTDEIIEIAKSVESTDQKVLLNEIAFKNSLNIFIFSDETTIKYTSANSEIPFAIQFEDIISMIEQSEEYYITFNVELSDFDAQGVVYASYLNGNYYVITGNVEPITSVVNVLSNQLFLSTIIILILASVIAIYISKRITNPINKITLSAKKLAEGDYDTNFELTEYEELNTLVDTLNYSAKEFKKTDSLRKELIANVSHDIKTPITIIKAYSEKIKDLSGENKEKREKDLDIIINQTDLLNKLVNDMMDLSKLETKTLILDEEQFDIVKCAEEILDGFRYLEEYKFILKTNEQNINVTADKLKITQVLNNLISNAINYVGEDKTVYVNLNYNDYTNKTKVEVKDNGKGIEDTTNIFDRYYKSNDKFRKSGFGTGLGLSIVKNILEIHNFEYGVKSELGKGTTFYFKI